MAAKKTTEKKEQLIEKDITEKTADVEKAEEVKAPKAKAAKAKTTKAKKEKAACKADCFFPWSADQCRAKRILESMANKELCPI